MTASIKEVEYKTERHWSEIRPYFAEPHFSFSVSSDTKQFS